MNQIARKPPTEAVSSAVMDSFRTHVQKTTGISLQPSKAAMIHQRLRRRVIECGFETTDDYLKHLMSSSGAKTEMVHAVDLITTNTTSFFREPQHFDFMTKTMLPELAARNGRRRVKVWSAAASEGAEAYTAAMIMAEAQRRGLSFDYAILGTDISTRILEKAERAIFSADQVAGIDPDLMARYFMRSSDPQFAGMARIVPELRRKVRFGSMNLMAKDYPIDRDINAVFLRNVLIYFDSEDQRRVVDNVAKHIATGGYLFVGHSESMIVDNPSLKQVIPAVFQKV